MISTATVYVSLFFAVGVALLQGFHCYYVSKDPIYKGKLGLGWPWFHEGVVNLNAATPFWRNYGVQSTLTLFVACLVLSICALTPIFSGETFDDGQYALAVLALVALGAISQLMGPAGYKGFITLFMVGQIAMLCYMVRPNPQGWILNTYITATVAITFPIAIGWMQIMQGRMTKPQKRKSLYVMGLYAFLPLLFAWIAWAPLLVWLGQ